MMNGAFQNVVLNSDPWKRNLHLIVEMNQSPGKVKFEDQAKTLHHGFLSTILSAVQGRPGNFTSAPLCPALNIVMNQNSPLMLKV